MVWVGAIVAFLGIGPLIVLSIRNVRTGHTVRPLTSLCLVLMVVVGISILSDAGERSAEIVTDPVVTNGRPSFDFTCHANEPEFGRDEESGVGVVEQPGSGRLPVCPSGRHGVLRIDVTGDGDADFFEVSLNDERSEPIAIPQREPFWRTGAFGALIGALATLLVVVVEPVISRRFDLKADQNL